MRINEAISHNIEYSMRYISLIKFRALRDVTHQL
jgi:hypothetical protein